MTYVANDEARLKAKKGRRPNTTPYSRKAIRRGYVHKGLMLHLRKSVVPERILVYESMMNETTLKEWIKRNRPGGAQTGEELYLKPGLFVHHLDNDLFNSAVGNLYCFENQRKFISWKRKNQKQIIRLQPNMEEIKVLCASWTASKWKQMEKEGRTALWGVYRMTHVVMMTVGFNSAIQNEAMYTLLCSLTGQRVITANKPHAEVELENGQKIWVTEERIRERVSGDH